MTDNMSLTTDISVNRHDTGMRPQAGPRLDIPSSRPLPAQQPFKSLFGYSRLEWYLRGLLGWINPIALMYRGEKLK